MKRAWVREIEDDLFIATNDGEGFFYKGSSFLRACEVVVHMNRFVDAFNKLADSVHGRILLEEEII